MIPYGKHNITDEDIQSVVSVLKSDFLTQGPKVKEFEENFASYVGSKYAIAVNNGTAALHLATLALNLSKGEKVITTPITFVASANCVRYSQGEVIFSDIDPDTLLIDIDKVELLLKNSPLGTYKGIILVDFAGRAINLEKFQYLAKKYSLWLIEDACHAPGGYFIDTNGEKQKCGNGLFADISIFSFHPVKHIACGEGGMITTNNKSIYEKILNLRTHGIQQDSLLKKYNHGSWYYEMQELGYNYRLTDFQAALGISQLKRADEGLSRRREIAEIYNAYFSNKNYILNHSSLVEGHAYHLYIIEVKKRDDLYYYLRENNIITQIHYIPSHLMPYYRQFGWKEGDLSISEQYYKQCLSIPIYPTLTNEEQEFVINKIEEFYNG